MGEQFQAMEPREAITNPLAKVAEVALVSGDESELDALACRVLSLLEKGARFDDICILARTNKQLETVSEYLQNLNIPTHVHAASGFFERREILDAFFFIKVLVAPYDDFSLIGLLRSPWFYVEDQKIVEWVSQKGSQNLWNYLVKKNEVPDSLLGFFELSHKQGVVETFGAFLKDSSFLLSSQCYDPTGRRESNLWKLYQMLKEGELTPGFNLLEFIHERVPLKTDLDHMSESDAVAAVEPNRVNLMTVHASKGLKFTHILLPFTHKRPNLTSSLAITFDDSKSYWSFPIPLGEEEKITSNIFDSQQVQKLKK